MTTLQRLNLRYYRTTSPEEQADILACIDAILAEARCPACGEAIEDGGSCWSIYCPEGRENIDAEMADRQYHASIDRALLEHDR